MWLIIIIIVSLWILNILMGVCLGFQFVVFALVLPCKFSPRLFAPALVLVTDCGQRRLSACVNNEFRKRRLNAGAAASSKLQKEVGSWRSMNGPLSWVECFVHWEQCVAFMGDSSLGSSDHAMGTVEWSSIPCVPRGSWSLHYGSEWGGEGLFLLGPRSQLN